MLTNQWTKPLLSMSATFMMCAILSACQSSNASNYHYSNTDSSNHIHVQNHNGLRSYEVNGKKFSFSQLSDEQKKKIKHIETQLNQLETAIEFESDEMEKWGDKMEAVAEKIELEAEQFENIMQDFEIDFQDDFENGESFTQEMRLLSKKLTEASKILEVKMKKFETKMHSMQIDMPKIDQQKIADIKFQVRQYETLLVKIAETI